MKGEGGQRHGGGEGLLRGEGSGRRALRKHKQFTNRANLKVLGFLYEKQT